MTTAASCRDRWGVRPGIVVAALLFACSNTPTERLVVGDGGPADAGVEVDRDGGVFGASDAGATDAAIRDSGARDAGVFRPVPLPRRICAGDGYTCFLSDLDGEVICTGGFEAEAAALGPAIGVACGAAHVCSLKTDGALACVGEDADGQATPPAGTFVAVSAGDVHGCALDPLGAIVCWGRMIAPPTGAYFEIDSGARHVCAVSRSGALSCFGANDSMQASPPAGPFERVFLGGDRSCAKLQRGGMTCWGRDRPFLQGAVYAALGDRHACGITGRGFVQCEGDNENGQTALQGDFIEIAAGRDHTCGIRPNGDVECGGLR